MKKKKDIIGIVLISFLAMLCVWPLGFVKETESFRSEAGYYYDSGFIKDDKTYTQEFVSRYSYIEKIGIQLSRKNTFQHGAEGDITFSLYDVDNTLLRTISAPISEIESEDYHEFTVKSKVLKGETYHYKIEIKNCESEGPTIKFWETNNVGLIENKVVHYAGTDFPQYATVSSYTYRTELGIDDVLLYYAWIVTIALLCYTIMKLFRNEEVST